jgi:peptide/nickel transport system permease protein
MKMWIFVIRRLLLLVPVIIGVMTITFVLISTVPNTARCTSAFGPPPIKGGAVAIQGWYNHCVKALALNQPAVVQWGIYMENSLSFNWGTVNNHSFAGSSVPVAAGQPVTTVLSWFLPYTLELALISLALIMFIALPLGNLSAVYRNRPVDQAARVMSFSGYALPTFLLGALTLTSVVLLIGPSTHWQSITCPGQALYTDFFGSWPQAGCFPGTAIFPNWLVSGQVSQPTHFPTVDAAIHGEGWIALDTILRMILPALTIAYGTIAVLLRFVRNSMLEVLNLDFVRTARAKGVPEAQVIKRHAGRNSLNVTITVLGLTFAFFLGGFPVTEEVFGLEGVGRMLAFSVQQPYDYGLIFGATLLFTYLVVVANIIVDVLYAYLDPRVRLG